MKGKLIIIEAGDGSGKATQTEELYRRLVLEKFLVKKIEFPNYTSESAALVKMYLKGEFGTSPDEISPYVASTFYTVDRYASFKKEWEEFYNSGGIILSDRYTTSNMVHQAAKIADEAERNKYLDWLYDFEYRKFRLPIPDCVIFLDMPPEVSFGLISKRANKSSDIQRDIHEADEQYLIKSYNNANWIASKYHWHKVECVSNSRLKTIQEIHDEVYRLVSAELLRPQEY
ncbi:thymidylate kinase [Desulfosporosinus sp. Sb-LF]|uniref:dTMP kinase n=1 Tax=Desulfosporosinus sp. Sb-LF TaxID=2560027 RepID=UPI00107F0F58|nr:thymidylate kinase [Desulfosporosinus sp. Sb-LF]TGE32356.1 thymidylate kinase [Desulfosporosinus sp. Sb-LF]